MWVTPVTLPYILLALLSVWCFARILSVALYLRDADSEMCRNISWTMIGTCVEIALATLALFMDRVLVYFIIKGVARLIEVGCYEYFWHDIKPRKQRATK